MCVLEGYKKCGIHPCPIGECVRLRRIRPHWALKRGLVEPRQFFAKAFDIHLPHQKITQHRDGPIGMIDVIAQQA
jgi:hypothetical protein